MERAHPLQDFRKRQKPPMSRPALARFLEVSRMSVLRWEKGRQKIDGDLLPKVSEKTGIPKSVLRPDLVELLKEAAE
jgi:transcriptional regulator with XRE-family HTH domain